MKKLPIPLSFILNFSESVCLIRRGSEMSKASYKTHDISFRLENKEIPEYPNANPFSAIHASSQL